MLHSRSKNVFKLFSFGHKQYSQCCPPRNVNNPCPPPPLKPGAPKRILPQSECRPGPIPPNPCVPKFPHGKDSWKKYKYIVFFVSFPLIILQALNTLSHKPPAKNPEDCRDFEYMRRFTKKFPWKNGDRQTLFHNEHANFEVGECEPPDIDCD